MRKIACLLCALAAIAHAQIAQPLKLYSQSALVTPQLYGLNLAGPGVTCTTNTGVTPNRLDCTYSGVLGGVDAPLTGTGTAASHLGITGGGEGNVLLGHTGAATWGTIPGGPINLQNAYNGTAGATPSILTTAANGGLDIRGPAGGSGATALFKVETNTPTAILTISDNSVSSFVSQAALTLTGAGASTWKTTAGALTVSGFGGLNLQNNGTTVVSVSASTAGAGVDTTTTLGSATQRWQRVWVMGTANVAGDYALSSGWGGTATVTSVTGSDSGGTFIVTANGASFAANPTITLTFKDGTWTNAPNCFAKIEATSDSSTSLMNAITETTTATTNVITYNGTPVGSKTYTFRTFCQGQ